MVEQWSRGRFLVVAFKVEQTMAEMNSKHVLDCYEIDSLDEIDDGMQIARVWCNTHLKYEWHSIPLDRVRNGGPWSTQRRPLWVLP